MGTTMKTRRRLPKRLSTLLTTAVDDAQAVQRMMGYELNMAYWHEPLIAGGACKVCLAGAVMVKELGAACRQSVDPESFDEDTSGKLQAINSMRVGHFLLAREEAGVGLVTNRQYDVLVALQDRLSIKYKKAMYDSGTSTRLPWRDYRDAARKLRAVGL